MEKTNKKMFNDLKKMLKELSKNPNRKQILNEFEETSFESYGISLSEIAQEIINERKELKENKPKEIQSQLILGKSGKGGWKRTTGENISDYEERVKKADYRLGALLKYIETETSRINQEILKTPEVKNLDTKTQEIIKGIMLSGLREISKHILEELSVYPFQWDFDVDNIETNINKFK